MRKLRNTYYKIGYPLMLECTFTGSQRIYVSWRKDGKPIWASYKYNVKTTKSSSTLEVLNSDRREAVGKYLCEISNSEGTAICQALVKIGNDTNNLSEYRKSSWLGAQGFTLSSDQTSAAMAAEKMCIILYSRLTASILGKLGLNCRGVRGRHGSIHS